MVDPVKESVLPKHSGLLFDAVGVAGGGETVTEVVPAGPVHPFAVAVTEYVPDAKVVTLPIVGFCVEEEKLFGPVHA